MLYFFVGVQIAFSIYYKQERSIFDLRNIQVAMVDGDPLGIAFGVKAFARCQVT